MRILLTKQEKTARKELSGLPSILLLKKISDYLFTMFLTQTPDLTNAKAIKHFMISVALIMATIKMMEMPVK